MGLEFKGSRAVAGLVWPFGRTRGARGSKASTRDSDAPAAEAEAGVGAGDPVEEPVWLVRAVLVLFLIGFAAFLAREIRRVVESMG